MAGSNAFANNCTFKDGQTLGGEFLQSPLFYQKSAKGFHPEGTIINITQNGCRLEVRSRQRYNAWDSKTLKSVRRTDQTGTWVFDLSGNRPAEIPKEFIVNNSHDSNSKTSAESLVVYTKKVSDEDIDITAEFIVEASGIKQRLRAKSNVKIRAADTDSLKQLEGQKRISDREIRTLFPGVSFELIPDDALFEEQGARYLAIQVGSSWMLKFLEEPLNLLLKSWDYTFHRIFKSEGR